MELPDVVPYAVPLFILTMLVELAIGRIRGGARYQVHDSAASLAMGSGNLVIGMLLGFITYSAHAALAPYALFDLGYAWWVFLLAFLLEDHSYYWFHRVSHERRWLWAAHVNHHSSQHYNLSTALRQTWSSHLALGWVFWLPLTLIGIDPAITFFFGGISLVYQYWIHTELIDRLPAPIEAVFNTPSHHRVHHASNPRYLDANYAGILIIWDRLYRSFVPEQSIEAVRYGLVHDLGTFNPLRIAFHEWVNIARDLSGARSLREVVGYTWGPPGWSPDGSRKTSLMLQEEWASRTGQTRAPG